MLTSLKLLSFKVKSHAMLICNGGITFPKIRGTKRVRTRLLNNCLVGIDIPTPAPMNFDIEKGT